MGKKVCIELPEDEKIEKLLDELWDEANFGKDEQKRVEAARQYSDIVRGFLLTKIAETKSK